MRTPLPSWRLGALIVVLLCSTTVPAQPAKPLSPDAIQRIDVPEDRLTDRPFRDQAWVPMDRDDFERLLSRVFPQPPGPTQPALRHVHYTAALTGDTLAGGRLQIAVQDLAGTSKYLSLGEPSFALEELSWSGGPAIWGTAPDGRHWLQLNPDEQTLEGRWSARGRTLLNGVTFELNLLPAAVSQLELLTPPGHFLTSDVGDVMRVEDAGDGESLRWRIDLGNQSRCRLMVTQIKPAQPTSPLVLYEQELAVAVSNEELLLRQVLLAEVLEGEIHRLTVSFPRQFEVVSVTYGDQTPLKYERIPGEGPSAQMIVTLPESVQGRTRPIRLEGFLRRPSSEPLAVPQFHWEGGLWLHGRVNVSVSRPWELRSYRATGYRQLSPGSLRTDAETISFQQLTPRAQLLLNVERPVVERTALALNVLTATDAIWTLTTEIAWESRSGTVFDASCRLPDGWQVVSVVQLGGDRELQELAGWEVQPHPDSGQVLRMEFSEGLTPGRVDPVRIVAHRNALAAPLTHVPVVTPIECESTEVLLTVDAQAGGILSLTSNAAFEPFDAQSAAAVWNTLPAWSDVLRGAPDSGRLFHLATAETSIPIPPDDAAKSLDAAVQVLVNFEERQVHEQFQIRLQAADVHREIELYAPHGAAGITWTIDDVEQPLVARRSDGTPSGAPGESWKLTFPKAVSGDVTLTGQRTVPQQADYVVPLLFVPRARRFQGRVILATDSSDMHQLREVPFRVSSIGEHQENSAEDLSDDRPREWNYRNWDREWLVQPRRHQPIAGQTLQFRLSSILTADDAAGDYHQLHLSSQGLAGLEEFRFQLDPPAEMIAVLQAGQPLPFTTDGRDVTVTGWEQSAAGDVAILYRVPAAIRLCGMQHSLVLPRLSMPYTEWNWDVCLPPGMVMYGEPLGMHFSPQPSRPGWFQRLCGPFSRAPGEAVFPPLTFWRSAPNAISVGAPVPVMEARSISPRGLEFPEHHPVYRATHFGVPSVSTFVLWDRHALRQTTWAVLLGCFPVGFWLRSRRSLWQKRLATLVIGTTMCLAVFGPDGWNVVFGGGCSGLLLACLLPHGIWARLSRSPDEASSQSMSTQVYHKGALPLVLWIAFGSVPPWTVAQEQPPADETAAPTVAAKDRKPNYQVLVPVDRQQQPSQKLPVVYVSPDLHEKLASLDAGPPADPVQLIESAEYIVYADQNRRPALKIKYHVDVLPGNDWSKLIVPLVRRWSSGLESCTVDGRSQSAILTPDGLMLVLPTESSSTESDAETTGRPERHEVLLDIRLPMENDPLEGGFTADVSPVLNSRLAWQSAEGLRWFEVPEARGTVTVSLDRQLIEAQLGAVETFQFRRGTGDRPPGDEGTTEVQLLQLLTLHPMLTQGTFRAECRVLDGGPSRMDLELPAGAVLREIRGHKILQTTLQSEAGGASRVVLEFQEPQRQNFVVEGEYILPRPSSDQNFDLPRTKIRCGKPATSQRNLVAVANEPGFSAQMINLDDPTVLPIPVEQFVSQWGDTVPNQLPRFAFQVQDGGQPSFRLATVQPEQQVLSFREDVTISSRRLDWVLTADLKSSSPSSFSYSVLLDRRLSIEQVSVRENGTDQLLRWSKTPMIGSSQNRLTLFLNRESTGISQLRIHGSLRVRPSSPIALPSVRFETAQSVPGTLTLFHEAGHRLELDGRQVAIEGEAALPDLSSEPITFQFFKRLKVPEGDSGLTARLEPAAGACRVESIWFLNPAAPKWTIRGRMELTPLEGTQEIRIAVPERFGKARLLLPESGPRPSEQVEDGQRVLQIRCDQDPSAVRVLLWDVEVTAPAEPTLRWHLPSALHAVQADDYVALAPDPGWLLNPQPSAPVSTLSEGLRDQLVDWDGNAVELLSRITDDSFVIQRVDHQSPDGLSSVILVEHQLQGTPDGGWQGQSDFHPQATAGTIEIVIPEGLEILDVVTDGRTLSADPISRTERRWRIQNAGQHRSLGLRWRSPPAPGRVPFAGLATIPLPWCVQERPPTTLATITPAGDSWLTVPHTLHRRERWELAFERLEWLLQRHQQRQAPDSSNAGLSQDIWAEYRSAAEKLPVDQTSRQLSPESRQRWETITQAVNKIEDPGDRSEPASLDTAVASLPDDQDRTIYAVLPPDATDFRCWMIRRDAVNWASAGVLLAIGWWLLPWVIGLQSTPWLAERRHAGWFVFGAVWWLCLSPSIIGFAVMTWAVLGGAWQRRLRVVVNH